MRAARLHAREVLRVEEVPAPGVPPGHVKLRNAFSGICGSDLHLYYSPEATGLDLSKPHPLTGSLLPQILGHEFSGTVAEVGSGVDGVRPGDRAAVFPLYSCGQCAACARGRANACRLVGFHGLTSDGGGMAEFTTVTADRLHLLPDNVDLRMGALVEPMAVAWHAVTVSKVRPGQSAVIMGAGPIGIGVWFALRARGIDRVLVSEPSRLRREAVELLGAATVDPASADLPRAVDRLTGGAGADTAFDAAGAGPAFASLVPSLAPGGRGVIVAMHERPADFNPTALVMAETELAGALAYLPEDFDAVIAAMAQGAYNAQGWIQEMPMEDVRQAFETLRNARAVKILIAVG